MDLRYPDWLEEMANRAIKHGLKLHVSCEPTGYVLFEGAGLEQLLDELDDADDTDDGTADICTIAPLKQFTFDENAQHE